MHELARNIYDLRVEAGVAREQARKDLPLATYTEAYWKIDLHNLLHFLALRMDEHAQLEIREYARVIGHEIVARWCPVAWQAFLDYRFNAAELTRIDLEIITAINAGDTQQAVDIAIANGLLPEPGKERKRNMEREELEEKMRKLKLGIPGE